MRSSNTNQGNIACLVRFIVTVAAVPILLLSCINPFATNYGSDDGGGHGPASSSSGLQRGSIVINPENSLQAQTIMPDLENLDSFAARRVISFTNITPGGLTRDPVDPWNGVDPIADIPYGTWTVTYEAFNAADDLIATGQATNVVINAESTPVLIDIIPLTAGDGTLEYTITFPPEAVTDVTVELVPWGGGTPLVFTAGNEFNADYADTGSLQIGAVIPSGAYRLRIQFSDNSTAGDGMHAPIVKIAQIYDGLVSSATTNITLAELRSPPDAPSNIIVEFTAENLFNVYWTDNSNTEQGFRMYQDDGFGNRQPLGTQLPAGTESATGLSSAFTPPVDDFTLEVVAFNQFGESAPLSFTFRLLGAAQFPNFQNSANTNSPLWAAAGNPGSINWGTMIVGGGSAVNLYAAAADISDVRTLPAPTATSVTPPFNLTGLGALSPLTQYFWRLENEGIGGGRVIYPVDSFTIRDNTIHVSEGGNPANGGSLSEPLDSIQAAIDIAENNETILVQPGNYNEAITVNKTGLLLQGSGDDAIITPPVGSGTTVIIASADVTVRDFQVRIGNLDTRSGITISGVNATVENNLVTEDPAAQDGVTIRGISGGVGQGARIAGNRIVLANITGVTMNTRWGINMTGSGENAANPLVIDGNKISYGDAPGTSNIAIQPQGDNQLITNNVLAQEGANAGQDFTGVRITVTPLNPRVIHNTIVNTNPQRTTYGLRVESGTDIVIANNIVAGIAAQFNTGMQQSGGTIVEANSNLFWNVISVAGALGATADAFNTQQVFAAGNIQGDPQLIDTASIESDEWFAPDSLSLIPDGDSAHLAIVSNDILGTARTRPTIGAYEAALPLTLVAHWPFSEGIELIDASVYGSTLGQSGDQVEPSYSEDPVGNFYSAIVQAVEGYTVAPSLATSSSSLGQTVSFWYRGTGVGNFQQEGTIIRRDRGDGSPVFRIGAADAITMDVEVNGTVQSNSLTFSGQLNAGVWNHIVVVFDYVNDEIRVYQDGFFRNVHPVAGPGFVDMTAPGNVYIGRNPNGATQADNAVPGDLDDVRIFNYALETAEVQNLFAAGR